MGELATVAPPLIGRVVSVNVGRPRQVPWHDRVVTTAIWKQPVSGRVRATGVNVDGDDQADRRVHGGPTKAIYAYATEDHAWWAEQLGFSLEPGTFGENLTIAGVDISAVVVGERWRIGTAELEVTSPRTPCGTFGVWAAEPRWVKRFSERADTGARRGDSASENFCRCGMRVLERGTELGRCKVFVRSEIDP